MRGNKRNQRRAEVNSLGYGMERTEEASLSELDLALFGNITPSAALAIQQAGVVADDDGGLTLHDFRMTSIGIEIRSDATYEHWVDMVDFLFTIEGRLNWLIGDAILIGERVYGKTYEEMALLTGKAVKTLRNYVYVVSSVEMSRRRDKLTFGHHAEVASMVPEHQDRWLADAEQNRWSVAELRKQLKGNDGLVERTQQMEEVNRFTSYINSLLRQNDNDLDQLNPEQRHAIAQRAEKLAVYWAGIAAQAKGE